jgi:hypothetical protein
VPDDPVEALIAFARGDEIAWVQACGVFEVPLPRDWVIEVLSGYWRRGLFTTELDDEQAKFVLRCGERYRARFALACAAGTYAAYYRKLDELEARAVSAEMFQGCRLSVSAGEMWLELRGGPAIKIVRVAPATTPSSPPLEPLPDAEASLSGRKPGGGTPAETLAAGIALTILESPQPPELGHGLLRRLAKKVMKDPEVIKAGYKLPTIEKAIRPTLREWNKKQRSVK